MFERLVEELEAFEIVFDAAEDVDDERFAVASHGHGHAYCRSMHPSN